MNKKNLIYGILKEITQGNQNQTPKPIIRVEDSKITKFIISFFEKRKDADLIVLNSNGDIWTIDVRAIVVSDDDKQTIRERAKALTYQVKRELEETLMKEFAIPNMSIQGIKPVQNNTCDFVISFIYSNKNVDRTNFYENKNPKIVEMLKEILKESELSKKDQKEVKKFTDAYHKFTEQGKTTEAKQALKLATEAEENITKCKTSIAKLNESKQSLTEDNYQSLLSKISPSWLNNSYVTNVIDGKEVDLYTIAPQEERDLVLKGYLNFSEEQLKTMNEEEKKNLFNANIFHASLKAKSKSAKPKNRRLSLSQWAKQEGRNINEVGIEKDYKANYLNKRGLTEDVSRFNEIFDKVIPVIDVNVLNKSKQVETINNKTLYQLPDGRMYCQMNPTKGVVTNDKVNNPQEFTNWFSMILREGKNSKVAKILKEILTEDVYYPSQEKERDFEQELQELVDIWVEENIGSESAQGFVSKNPNEIAIKVWALPDNKNIPEAGKSEWRYTAEELCKFLNSQDRQFPFEFHIGSASMTSCWIFTKLN